MVKYFCIFCKKDFEKKHNYVLHNAKKRNCRYVFNESIRYYKNMSIEKLLNEYNNLNTSENIIKHKMHKNYSEITPKLLRNYSETAPKQKINNFIAETKKNNIKKEKFKYSCKKCKEKFSRLFGLQRHLINKVCNNKNKDYYDKVKQNIQIINNNNTNNTINNNININMIPLRYVDYNNIPSRLQKDILEKPALSIQKLLLHQHFNKNKPEQMNILYSNRRDSKMLVYDETELSSSWSTRDKDEICEIILSKAMYAIENVMNDNDEQNNFLNISQFKINNINSLFKDLDYKKNIRKDMKNNICDICYDNNSIVKNNKTANILIEN